MVKSKFLLLLAGLIVLIAGCTIKEPQMPSWDTQFTIPLATYTFKASDLVSDSTIFTVSGSDSLLGVDISGTIDRQEINDTDLSVAGIDSSSSLALDTIKIDSLNVLSVPDSLLSLRHIAPGLESAVGQTVTIPESQGTVPGISLTASDFASIHLASGTLELRVTNHFPVTLLADSRIRVYSHPLNPGDDSLMVDIPLGQDLQPGEFAVKSGSLLYPWVISPLTVELNPHSAASASPVSITDSLLDNSSINVQLQLMNLRADKAISQLSRQEYTWSETIAVTEDSNKVYTGTIKSGRIHLNITNQLPIFGEVRVKFWNLIRTNGSPFEHTLFIDSSNTTTDEIILDGIKLVNINAQGFPDETLDKPIDSIRYEVSLLHEKFEHPIVLEAPDSVIVTVQMDSIYFERLRGEIQRTTITIDPVETTDISDYEAFDGTIDFRNLRLIINLQNEIAQGAVHFTLNLKGYREENGHIVDSVSIAPLLSDSIVPGSNRFEVGNPATEPAIADKIAQLVNMLPTRIVVDGSAWIEGMVDISSGQGLYGDYAFSAPFEIKLEQPLTYNSEELSMGSDEINQDVKDAINEGRIQDIEFFTQVANGLPLGGEFTILFADSSYTGDLFDTTQVPLYLKINSFQAASVDQSGFVAQSTNGSQTISLDGNDIKLFARTPLRYGFMVRVNPTTGQANNGYIKLQSFNKADINGQIRFKLRIDEDL